MTIQAAIKITIQAMLNKAVKFGYYPVSKIKQRSVTKLVCPQCKQEAIDTYGPDDRTWPVFVDPEQAYELASIKGDKLPVIACRCNFRCYKEDYNTILAKVGSKSVNNSAVKPFTPPTDTSARICKTPGCNNILPADRKAKCYTCIPQGRGKKQAVTEAASRNNPTPFAPVIPTHQPPVNY